MMLVVARRMRLSNGAVQVIADSASAATGATPSMASFFLRALARVWPPTRAKATTIVAVFLVGVALIGGTIAPKKGKTHREFIAKKKELKLEKLTKLLDEARRCKPASAEAKAAIEKIEDSLLALGELKASKPSEFADGTAQDDVNAAGGDHQQLLWPPERQQWLQSTLAEKDGVELAIRVIFTASSARRFDQIQRSIRQLRCKCTRACAHRT